MEHVLVVDQDGWVVGVFASMAEAGQRAKLLNSIRMTGPLGLTRSFRAIPVAPEVHQQAVMRKLLVYRDGGV